MHSKTQSYFSDALAACGFVIAASSEAYAQRRDLWASPFNAATDIISAPDQLRRYAEGRGAKLYRVDLEGIGLGVPVISMSHSRLCERIEWISGRRATNLRPLVPTSRQEPTRPAANTEDAEPPRYPCQARTKWFEARGLKDPDASGDTKFPPRRVSL